MPPSSAMQHFKLLSSTKSVRKFTLAWRWIHQMGHENNIKRGVLTAESPGPSSLPVYHIKTLQGRKVMLFGWGNKQGMWSHKWHKQRGKQQQMGKAEHRETSPWFPSGWMSVHPVQIWCQGSSSYIRQVFSLCLCLLLSLPLSVFFFLQRVFGFWQSPLPPSPRLGLH